MMARDIGLKRERAGAAVTATGSGGVGFEHATTLLTSCAPSDANTFARAWVARRFRAQVTWAAIIADAAGLGGRS